MCRTRHVRNLYLRCGHAESLPPVEILCGSTHCKFSVNHPPECPQCERTCNQYRLFPEQYTPNVDGFCSVCTRAFLAKSKSTARTPTPAPSSFVDSSAMGGEHYGSPLQLASMPSHKETDRPDQGCQATLSDAGSSIAAPPDVRTGGALTEIGLVRTRSLGAVSEASKESSTVLQADDYFAAHWDSAEDEVSTHEDSSAAKWRSCPLRRCTDAGQQTSRRWGDSLRTFSSRRRVMGGIPL
ncbi:hypothetical protein B0H17DRAFT_97931 [Mycena rosella]|uniref:Uncharacterized protein n=1 Tax=Mycena rosella TaxID=1033263 RepID=A0AAD7E1V3_MYCRO|nr:hypothetical protein B0H17DRAFT_97931 [Mycena rosella]